MTHIHGVDKTADNVAMYTLTKDNSVYQTLHDVLETLSEDPDNLPSDFHDFRATDITAPDVTEKVDRHETAQLSDGDIMLIYGHHRLFLIIAGPAEMRQQWNEVLAIHCSFVQDTA